MAAVRDESVEITDHERKAAMTTDTKNVQMTLSMSPPLEAKLGRLAVASGSTEADVLLKAITLYEIALQAKLKDQSLAIVDDKEHVVYEVSGIQTMLGKR